MTLPSCTRSELIVEEKGDDEEKIIAEGGMEGGRVKKKDSVEETSPA